MGDAVTTKTVPLEPTPEMLRAGNRASLDLEVLLDDEPFSCERATYVAMVAAAPAPTTAPIDGEFYWIRHGDGPVFIAEYVQNNRDRWGREAAPCFWVNVGEVLGSPVVVEHIKKPETAK